MMKARKHRGSFAESLETLQEIEPTWEAIEKYFGCPRETLELHKSVFDEREGWKAWTYLVLANKEGGVIGMTSQYPE